MLVVNNYDNFCLNTSIYSTEIASQSAYFGLTLTFDLKI